MVADFSLRSKNRKYVIEGVEEELILFERSENY